MEEQLEGEKLEGERIVPIGIEDHMKTSYIDYSMSVIVARALPDYSNSKTQHLFCYF